MNNDKPFILMLAALIVLVFIVGLILPGGIRGALANNLWSISMLHRFFNRSVQVLNPATVPDTHPHAGIFLARQALLEDDLDSALMSLVDASNAADPVAQDAHANLLYQRGDYPAAIEMWGKAGNTLALEHAARAHQGGETPEVEALAYRALYQIQPEKYTSSLAVSLKNNDQSAEAVKILEQSLRYYPDSEQRADWYRYLADIYQRQGLYEEAESAYLSALDIDPENFRTWRNLGLMYKSRQFYDFDKAIQTFWQMTQRFPEDTTGFLQMGELYESAGDVENARIVFQRALQLDPANAQAQQALERLGE
jgi:tetratricopeptide (TPR) repeat protein